MPDKRTRSIIVLLAILLAALLLRLYRLNEGLWLDEIFTYVNYARLPFGKIIRLFDSENQHFLYSLLAHASFVAFGESAWALRLPAVLFGVGSLAALYGFGKQTTSQTEALLATGLMAFSYHHVWFSQNGRGYTGLLFWTLLSSYFLLRSINTNRPGWWAAYAAAAALGMYTHLTMAFVICGQLAVFGWALLRERRTIGRPNWQGLWLGFGLAGLLTLALHAPVLSQIGQVIGGSEVSVVNEWKNPLWTVLEILKGLQLGLGSLLAALAALAWFTIGLISYLRHRAELPILLLGSTLSGAGVTLAVGHHLWPRFFFFALGFGVLVVVRGGMVIAGWAGRLLRLSQPRTRQLGVWISLAIIAVSAVSVPLAYGPKQDYQGALAYMQANQQPGDAVAAAGLAADIYQSFYAPGMQAVELPAELEALRSQAGRTWLVYTFRPVLASVNPSLLDYIDRNFRVVQEFPGTVGEGSLFVCLAEP